MSLRIGDLRLKNPFLLAPLAGITDQAMRSLCCQAGASLTYTEMVSAKGLWYGDRKTADLLAIADDEGPVAYQLFGSEPVVLAHAVYELSEVEDGISGGIGSGSHCASSGTEDKVFCAHSGSEDKAADRGSEDKSAARGSGDKVAARGSEDKSAARGQNNGGKPVAWNIPGPPPKPWKGYTNDRRPVLFDLNAGCPVPKIVKNGEGSALLKNPDVLYDCVSAMCDASRRIAEKTGISRPVTVKIRKGFARDEDLAVENAKAIEAAGAAAVTVHGRCREQYYDGSADWECIARVKDALKIPVIGNGDVMCGEDAVRMMKETGCDGVMIARGALGNPWIFTEAVQLYEEWKGADQTAEGSRAEERIITYGEQGKTPRGIMSDDPTNADRIAKLLEHNDPTNADRIAKLLEHIDLVCRYKDEYTCVREIRKHVGWYIKGMHGATEIRRRVNGINDVEELRKLLYDYSRELSRI